MTRHARPMADYRRARTIRYALACAAELAVLVPMILATYAD